MQKIHKHKWKGQEAYQQHRHKYHLNVLQTVLKAVLKTVLKTVLWTVLQTVLCYAMFLLFFFIISAASLWPWATRPGCFSRVTNFFSSSVIFYLTQNPRGNSFRIYKPACLDFFKRFLATTNSSSVSTSFSSCIIIRSRLSFGYLTNMAFACHLKFFDIAEQDCVSNHK